MKIKPVQYGGREDSMKPEEFMNFLNEEKKKSLFFK